MNNADLFKLVFGKLTATELWAMEEDRFLDWLNTEIADCYSCKQCDSCEKFEPPYITECEQYEPCEPDTQLYEIH